MTSTILRPYIVLLVLLLSCQTKGEGTYVCKPCNLPCDELTFNRPGTCPECKMALEKKLVLNEISIEEGSGSFLIEGAQNRKNKTIQVYYHKPKNFTTDSKVLLVVPGAGRNANSYRDTWVKASEKHNVLVLSPRYSEKDPTTNLLFSHLPSSRKVE